MDLRHLAMNTQRHDTPGSYSSNSGTPHEECVKKGVNTGAPVPLSRIRTRDTIFDYCIGNLTNTVDVGG